MLARRLAAVLLFAASLLAQGVHYELKIRDVAEHLAEVTADFPSRGQDHLDLFLPVWSPGFYVQQDYAANVDRVRRERRRQSARRRAPGEEPLAHRDQRRDDRARDLHAALHARLGHRQPDRSRVRGVLRPGDVRRRSRPGCAARTPCT
jgi:hypothetical protein